MKKLSVFLALMLGVALLALPVAPALASQLDQSNQSSAISNINIAAYTKCGQTFKPSMPKLDAVEVYVGNGTGEWMDLQVIDTTTDTVVASGGTNVSGWDWKAVSLGSVNVTTGRSYMIRLSTGAGLQWKLGDAGYANGEAYLDASMPTRDFWFKTYGTPAASTSPSASPSKSGLPYRTPNPTVDKSIVVAKNLAAKDVSDIEKKEPKVKLTWDKSTTSDIDGYHLYAKNGTKEFGLVAELARDKTEYEDTNVSFDTSYTYMVRAYRDEAESASSNEAKITPSKEKKEGTKYGFLEFGGPLWKSWSFWALVALGVALIGVIIWYFVDRAKRKKKEKGIKPETPPTTT